MTGRHNAGGMRSAALAAAIAVLCVPAVWARGQRSNAPAAHSAPAHASAPRSQPAQPNRPANQGRNAQEPQGRPQVYAAPRPPATGYPASGVRPPYPGAAYPGPAFRGQGYSRPAVPGYAPPGHLGDWLNQHRNLPVQEQERILRNDPSFRRLNPADQQRLAQQLHQVNQLSEEQRQRRLARAEALEHMSPQDRMAVNLAGRRWAALPAERQALMKTAFRDLRAVPLDQRQTVLNSARYQGVFSPNERGILTDMLRAEPFEPARP